MATKTPSSALNEPTTSSPGQSIGEHAVREEDEITILDLLITLAQRKWLVLRVTVGCAVLGTIVSFLLPTRYTATVTLLPPQQTSSIGSALTSQLGSGMAALAGGSLGLKDPNDRYIAMLKSRTVEDAMVQHFGLMHEYDKRYLSDARKAFEHHASVDGSGKDGLIHISVEDRDPNRAAELANGYVDQFRDLSEHLAITEAGQRRLFFERQLKRANENLSDAEEALKETQQRTGLIQLDSQARALIESAAALRAQITAKEVQIQAMQTYATNQNAQLVQAEQELDSLRAQLSKLGGSKASPGSGIIPPKGQVTEAGMEYVRRIRDVKYYETVFNILARQFEIAKLDEAKEGALIQVVDPAISPDKRSFPKRSLIIIAASAGGLLLGVFAAFVQSGFARLKADPAMNGKMIFLGNQLRFR